MENFSGNIAIVGASADMTKHQFGLRISISDFFCLPQRAEPKALSSSSVSQGLWKYA